MFDVNASYGCINNNACCCMMLQIFQFFNRPQCLELNAFVVEVVEFRQIKGLQLRFTVITFSEVWPVFDYVNWMLCRHSGFEFIVRPSGDSRRVYQYDFSNTDILLLLRRSFWLEKKNKERVFVWHLLVSSQLTAMNFLKLYEVCVELLL